VILTILFVVKMELHILTHVHANKTISKLLIRDHAEVKTNSNSKISDNKPLSSNGLPVPLLPLNRLSLEDSQMESPSNGMMPKRRDSMVSKTMLQKDGLLLLSSQPETGTTLLLLSSIINTIGCPTNPNKTFTSKPNQLFKNKFKEKNSQIISNGPPGKLPKNSLSLKPIFQLIKINTNQTILRKLSSHLMVSGLLMMLLPNFLNFILLTLEDGPEFSEEILIMFNMKEKVFRLREEKILTITGKNCLKVTS
jgi:hypothetical protein